MPLPGLEPGWSRGPRQWKWRAYTNFATGAPKDSLVALPGAAEDPAKSYPQHPDLAIEAHPTKRQPLLRGAKFNKIIGFMPITSLLL